MHQLPSFGTKTAQRQHAEITQTKQTKMELNFFISVFGHQQSDPATKSKHCWQHCSRANKTLLCQSSLFATNRATHGMKHRPWSCRRQFLVIVLAFRWRRLKSALLHRYCAKGRKKKKKTLHGGDVQRVQQAAIDHSALPFACLSVWH